jgi:DNA-binding winged helix-turn-helix (wHTH) protein/tetratricopeptide (TPR) repeat protein
VLGFALKEDKLLKQYKFGVFRLDLNLKCLSTKDGQTIDLTPKAMNVLTYLIENRHRVVTKEELLSNVWQEAVVNDGNVHVNISNIRTVLGRHEGTKFIKTISTQGYRFAEPVEEWLPESSTPASGTDRPDCATTDPEVRESDPPEIPNTRPPSRVWVWVSAVTALLVFVVGCFGAYEHRQYVHSPRYLASKLLTDAIHAHNAGRDQDSIELALKATAVDPSLIRAYLLAAWWETLNTVDDRTLQTDAILDQLKNQKIALSQTEVQIEEGIRFDNHLDITEAIRSFREATALSPRDVDTWRMYGFELSDNKINFDTAASAFHKCLSIEPRDTDCAVGQLQAQNALNQFDKSIELFKSLPEGVKQTPWVLSEFGYALLGKMRYNEAMAEFELENQKAQSAGEPSAINDSIEGRVQTMLLSGHDPIEVAKYLENEIQKYNGPPQQKANWELDLAAIDAASGHESEGITHASNALAISENWRKLKKSGASLVDETHALQFLAICHDFEKAAHEADSVLDNDDQQLTAAKLFIDGMREMTSPILAGSAVKTFEQAYDNDPIPLYDFYRGEALLSAGEAAKAKQALQRFLDHRGDFQEDYTGLALLIPRAEKELAAIGK